MSTTVAVVTGHFVVIAGDTQASCSSGNFKTSKIFSKGDALVGFCGDTIFKRTLQNMPDCQAADEHDVEDWCNDLVLTLHTFAEQRGLLLAEGQMNFSLVVASRFGIYHASSNGAIDRIERGHYATGSGGPFANGALAAMTVKDKTAVKSATKAVMIASSLDDYTNDEVQAIYMEIPDDEAIH